MSDDNGNLSLFDGEPEATNGKEPAAPEDNTPPENSEVNTDDAFVERSNGDSETAIQETAHVNGMFREWYLEYASYVILERAVPGMNDGLKPVQRRILHSMKEMDDGRFNKVANIIGHTMQYHPHGDAAIGDATVNLGQKDLLIETQGNWGDVRTGDRAAAARYIEARLSKFALEVGFNPDTTEWQLSYDGRKKEPISLPMKFPLLLAQGVEGIAVGLATKIMPHNFIELLKASINVLKGRKPNLVPDFSTGGMIDVGNYNGGARGGKIRVRSHIEIVDKRTLAIRDTPYGVTTSTLIDSIIKASDRGKIKIRKIEDNTAKDVEILIYLAQGVSPDVTIDALYAFTDCEVSISPNACVIIDEKPHFMNVNEILGLSTAQTTALLNRELEIQRAALLEKLHFTTLERIFIENRIYRDIEECETWEAVISTIDTGLKPFTKDLVREVTRDDIIRLTEIKIKRISKFDSFKADEVIANLKEELDETLHHLAHLTEYAIDYFQRILNKYGAGRERKTEIKVFDTIAATSVAVANEKLYVNRADGFVGYGLKKDEYISDCSDIDDVIVFRGDGKFLVTKIADKSFVGRNILHAAVWKKNDERMVYNAIYFDGESKKTFAKRFAVTAVTRDKEYDITQGTKGSKFLYLTANANSESEVVTINLDNNSRARIKTFDFDFADLAIKGRASKGNTITRYKVRKLVQKSVGSSTLGGMEMYLDETIGRLNTEERGRYLGAFTTDDKILVVYDDGSYAHTSFELTNRYNLGEIAALKKFDPEDVITSVYYDGASKNYYVKRFQVETSTNDKRFKFISEERGSKQLFVSLDPEPQVTFSYVRSKGGTKQQRELNLKEFIEVKGWKAIGNKLGDYHIVRGMKRIETPESVDEHDSDE